MFFLGIRTYIFLERSCKAAAKQGHTLNKYKNLHRHQVQVYYYVSLINLVIFASICQIICLQETQKLIKI